MENWLKKVGRFCLNSLKRHWLVISLLCVFSVIIFNVERYADSVFRTHTEFFYDIIVQGIIVPIFALILLGLLDRAEMERNSANQQISIQKSLDYQIASAQNWQDLAKVIVQFPETIVPLIGSALWLYIPQSREFSLCSLWGFTGMDPDFLEQYAVPEGCQECVLNGQNRADGAALHACRWAMPTTNKISFYCLPLRRGGKLVALLRLSLLPESSLDENHIRLLNSIAPEMAMAINEARTTVLTLQQNQANFADRQRIAHDLHDTIAQDLAYLRFRLDQLSDAENADLFTLARVRQEMQRMRTVADEAYEVVRGTLEALTYEPQPDLASSLKEYAFRIGDRAGFELVFESEGAPFPFPIYVQTHMFYIFRELMANIEKHAQAHKVLIKLSWKEDETVFQVNDDGAGFDPDQTAPAGHYGLEIIRERVRQINGQLVISSSPDFGTQIQMIVPHTPGGANADASLEKTAQPAFIPVSVPTSSSSYENITR